jgi:hypothetical protein
MNLKHKIRHAQALAEFANLTPEKVGRFRRIESDFVPQDWWDYRPTNEKGEPQAPWAEDGITQQWQLNQSWLRKAWKKHFDIDQFELIRLLTSVFDPQEIQIIPWHPRPAFADVYGMPDTMYPYQRAVVFLTEQRWRARLCEVCKAPFVAGHSRQKYCGQERGKERETCFDLVRKEQKRHDHSKHRKARNRKRRNDYAILHASRA